MRWTTHEGKPVDWTAPPHYQNGRLDLVLPGEDRALIDPEVLSVRRKEYMKIVKTRMRRAAEARR